MTMRRRRSVRPAYTLLEIILATSIGVVLLGALYVAMGVQLRHAQEARYAVDQGNLVRALAARITNDVSASLGPAPPPPSTSTGGSGGASGSGGAGTGTGGMGSGGANGGASGGSSGTSPSGGSGAGSSGGTGTSATDSTNSAVFNLGVQGDASHVVLYVSRLARRGEQVITGNDPDADTQSGFCDLSRVTYWLVQGSGGGQGLARQEVRQVTNADVMAAVPPDVPDPGQFVIAEEVKSLVISYFDGTQWTDHWDGTAAGTDGVTPLGPPAAIAFDFGLAVPGTNSVRSVRHVVALPSANGPGQPSTSQSSSDTTNSGR
jgi:hypothetical protein